MRAMSDRGFPSVDDATRQAALACIGKLQAFGMPGSGKREGHVTSVGDGRDMRLSGIATSPLDALVHIANALSHVDMSDQVWIVDPARARAEMAAAGARRAAQTSLRKRRGKSASLPSAIATWFRPTSAPERPLLYWLHSPTLRGVLTAGVEAMGLDGATSATAPRRGIFFNDASVWSPDRQQRVRPELPLWLAAQSDWLPYDPATAQELRALLCAALDALYVRGESGFCYLSAHDAPCGEGPPLGPDDARDAFLGMYRLRALPQTHPPYTIRLCGAGRALTNVMEAARWLQLDWGVACEVWSCPSYTRLAREAGDAERVAMLRGEPAASVSHLTQCLGDGRTPVLAVTGYARHIAHQIGAYVPARFLALGSDDSDGSYANDALGGRDESGESLRSGDTPGVRWIVLNALRLLVSEGTFARARIAEATRRYGIV